MVVEISTSAVEGSEFGGTKKGSHVMITQGDKRVGLIKGLNLIHLVYLQM